jgi:ATP-dependent DNA helicase PIF1
MTLELSKEQNDAYYKYIQGENIFITGPGGSGKSTLIRTILTHSQKLAKKTQVCALTGCAAVLLNCKAKTIHSWAGIGIGNGPIELISRKVASSIHKKRNWRNVDVLIIDEVSMMSQKMFELLDHIGKATRKNNKPFGGIQIILLGDFYQLPPIGNKDEIETTRFCFESPLWDIVFSKENTIVLKKIFRQRDDTYSNILNQIREGRLKKSSNEILMSLVKKGNEKVNDEQFVPTKLFPTRNKVDAINQHEMALLKTEEIEYNLKYLKTLPVTETEKTLRNTSITPQDIDKELKSMQNNLLCNETVKLKVGAQVMCIVNIEKTNDEIICNGSQGKVIRFSNLGLPVVKYTNGCEMEMAYHTWSSDNIPGIGVSQVPLILAWAITIHKSQGATLSQADIDVGSGIFECGQTYVAMSRVTGLEGLRLSSFDASKIYVNKKVREFYDKLK